MDQSRLLFAHVVGRPDADIDLAVAALLVGEIAGSVDIDRHLVRLDELAEGARGAVVAPGPDRQLRALTAHLFSDLGFVGNDRDYYDARNSYLGDVLDRRTGIPITLSIVLMEVARRVGVELQGIGFPGHFLVRAPTATGHVFVDPFRLGVRLDRAELEDQLRAALGSEARLRPEHTAPVTTRQILTRVLTNLRAIFTRNGDGAALADVNARLAILAAGPRGGTRAS